MMSQFLLEHIGNPKDNTYSDDFCGSLSLPLNSHCQHYFERTSFNEILSKVKNEVFREILSPWDGN
jgi:hypothetical protein